MHLVMGAQIAVLIGVCLLFAVNVLVLMICFTVWLIHEVVAHWDVRYTAPRRYISVWEMHAHNYLATLPMFTLLTVVVLNRSAFLDLVTRNWEGQLSLQPIVSSYAGDTFLVVYLLIMAVICAFPYCEEFVRCLLYTRRQREQSQT